MVTINRLKIKEEILNYIRNQDIISPTVRGVTTTTDTFTTTEIRPIVTLTNRGVKNIREVSVGDTTYVAFVDYDIINLETSSSVSIEFNIDVTIGSELQVTYDYGNGDRVYWDFPQDYVSIAKLTPRITFDLVSIATTNRSLNENLQQKSLVFEFRVFSGGNDVEVIAQNLYDSIFSNKKDFKRLNYLRASGYSSKLPVGNTSNNVFMVSFMYTASAEFEVEE